MNKHRCLMDIVNNYISYSKNNWEYISEGIEAGFIQNHWNKLIEREWKMMKDKDNNKYFESVHEWIAFVDQDRPNRLYYECKSCNKRYKMKDINVLRKICYGCFKKLYSKAIIENYLESLIRSEWIKRR